MTTKKISLVAIGMALFVVLSLCLQVPVFENYYLCLGYVVMMVFCYYFDPFSSVAVGTLGVVLYCLLTNGLRGMPGWATGNMVIGFIVAQACRLTSHYKKRWLRYAVIVGAIFAGTAIGILGIKSLVEMLLYAQPFALRMAKNSYAYVADVFVMSISLPACESLRSIIRKHFKAEMMRSAPVE